MVTVLRLFFIVVFVFMSWTVLSTSLESDLFEEWDALASIPWMRATLWDFYALMLPVIFWMWYREKSVLPRILWSIGFVGLGSIATSAYVLVRLFSVGPDAGPADILLRQKGN
ncbi:MAG TPA: DUF1475 family protein [Candidatus Krumholzibacterium sp.]|nr:DUF1475 family protein [Candidatus Krumholzibacterium sp.]